MRKPDNVIFDNKNEVYDAFKKNYPTSFNSKNFGLENITDLQIEAQPYFRQKFYEIKKEYDELLEKLKWNDLIFESKYKFNPIIGEKYHLYKKDNTNFLSLIEPEEWSMPYIGTFTLCSNHTWKKIK